MKSDLEIGRRIALAILCVLMLTGCGANTVTTSTGNNLSTSRNFTVEKGEVAYLTAVVTSADFPVTVWTQAGWIIAGQIGVGDAVPQDCQLHAREGISGQFYAACPGPSQLFIPRDGADFIDIILMLGRNSPDKIPVTVTEDPSVGGR